MSREAILNRLRRGRQSFSIQHSQNHSAHTPDVAHEQKTRHAASQLSNGQLQAEFEENINQAHAEVIHCTPDSWQCALYEHARLNGINSLIHGDDPQIDLSEITSKLQTSCYTQPINEIKSNLFNQIDAGLSVASAAIAATGTLLIRTGYSEPRALSLVPPIHYVLLSTNDIVPDLSSCFTELDRSQLPTNLLLISGPSKTADIQQTLAYGAHGPSRLIVLLMTSSDGGERDRS